MLSLLLQDSCWSLHWASSNLELAKELLEAKADADVKDKVMQIYHNCWLQNYGPYFLGGIPLKSQTGTKNPSKFSDARPPLQTTHGHLYKPTPKPKSFPKYMSSLCILSFALSASYSFWSFILIFWLLFSDDDRVDMLIICRSLLDSIRLFQGQSAKIFYFGFFFPPKIFFLWLYYNDLFSAPAVLKAISEWIY